MHKVHQVQLLWLIWLYKSELNLAWRVQDFNGKPVLQTGDKGFESSGHLESRENLSMDYTRKYLLILLHVYNGQLGSAWHKFPHQMVNLRLCADLRVTPTLLWTNGLVAATTGLTYAPWRWMHTNPDTTVLLIVPLWKSMMRGAMWSRCPCTAVSFELVWNYSKLGHLGLACADADRSLFWNLPFASLQIILAFSIHFWHLSFPKLQSA